jgi:hypothetical protein
VELSKNLKVLGVDFHCLLPCSPEFRISSVDQLQSSPNLLRNNDVVDVLYELRNENLTEFPLE